MITEIGIVAGEIWQHLDKNGKMSLSELVKELNKEHRNLILMSLGWLAREGHVTLEGIDDNLHVMLVTKKN